MKKCFLVLPLLLLVLFAANSGAQIRNAGFESWTGTAPDSPVDWYANNLAGFPPYFPELIPVTKSASPHSGQSAVQGTVVSYIGNAYGPVIQSFFSYSARPGSLTGYVHFAPVSHDTLFIVTWMYSNNLSQLVAVGEWGFGATGPGYTKFTIPLDYINANAPDSAWIEVFIGDGDDDSLHFGSTFLLDDLAFEGSATGIAGAPAKPASYALQQNYPNPFNPSTTIRFELPEASHVRLSVYNLLGEEVALLLDDVRQAGTYDQKFDASGLASGTYFFRIEAQKGGEEAGSFVQVRKMTILR